MWLTIKDSGDVAKFKDFLRRHPDSDIAEIARLRIEGLSADHPEDRAVPEAEADVPLELTHQEVRRVQARLAILGHDPGGADGLLGPKTTRAVTAYQEAHGLEVTGTLSATLMDDIGDRVPDPRVDGYLDEINKVQTQQRRTTSRRTTPPSQPQQPAQQSTRTVEPAPVPVEPERKWWQNRIRTQAETGGSGSASSGSSSGGGGDGGGGGGWN